ncbi:MAG: RimK family alpha-L-glutamate ligase [Putridiphycobacter sp.]
MLIYILSRNIQLYSTSRLVEATKKANHKVKVVNHMFCDLLIEDGKFSIVYEGEILEKPDYIIPRIGSNVTSYGEKVIRHFEKMGVPTLTSSDGLLNSRDKLKSIQILAEHDIKIPTTYFSNDFHEVESTVREKLGYPFILKVIEGTQGLGVHLIKNEPTAQNYFDHFSNSKVKVILQEFIKESSGRDIRIITVGNEVVATMERIAPQNEFRSNIHRGAIGYKIRISDEEKEMAIRALKALNLKAGGVDIIRSKKGPLILEVNSSPGLEGIENTTKIDVAGAIIKFIEEDYKKQKHDYK